MTVANAVKKLSKAGFEVTSNRTGYTGRKGSQVIEFGRVSTDSDTIFGVKVRSASDNDSAICDYSAGVWCDNISQAIRLASC